MCMVLMSALSYPSTVSLYLSSGCSETCSSSCYCAQHQLPTQSGCYPGIAATALSSIGASSSSPWGIFLELFFHRWPREGVQSFKCSSCRLADAISESSHGSVEHANLVRRHQGWKRLKGLSAGMGLG
jgi:hypothetical protein